MFAKLRSSLTYANIVSSICLFLVLSGGTAFALSGSNTVFSDDIKNGQVKRADVATNAVVGGKVADNSLIGADVASLTGGDVTDNSLKGSDVDESTLSGVNADKLDGKDSSEFLSAEAWHEIEPANSPGGNPDFENGWENLGGDFFSNGGLASTAAFYRDRGGRVHLKGVVKSGTSGVVFTLPTGYRPSFNSIFEAASDNSGQGAIGHVYVRGEDANDDIFSDLPGRVEAFRRGSDWISLDGISFRAGG